jgi:acetyl esterase/lipase
MTFIPTQAKHGCMVFLTIISMIAGQSIKAQTISSQKDTEYKLVTNIHYRTTGANTQTEDFTHCTLDIYYPANRKNFSTVIWFHGGGLTSGSKEIPEALKHHNMAVVGVEYRLNPTVRCPAYIEDAAAAVAWVFKHIAEYGGDSLRIYVSGHSAGAYLSLMVGLDKNLLAKYGTEANRIAGILSFSAQTITHFTIRAERGIAGTTPVIDQYAPLFHVRKDAPPILLLTGDREKELLGRYEENAYLWRMLKLVGHPDFELHEIQGYDHSGMVAPGMPMVLDYLKKRNAY